MTMLRARWRRLNLPNRCRLLFVGPVGAGKTTAIRSLSDVPPVDTDVPISAAWAEYGDAEKTTTTVGLDYGEWRPTAGISVALVGTPGQDRFGDVQWGGHSTDTRIVLWLRADRPGIAADADEWIPRFTGATDRLVIAVSRCDDEGIESVRRALAASLVGYGIPTTRILAADARERDSVMRVACAALDLPEEQS